MKELRKVLEDAGSKLHEELSAKFVPIPSVVCECGKPVTFVRQRRKFACSRCGREYELIVQVKQVE